MQIPAIRIARRKGWGVLVADGNAACEGAALADVFLHVDLKDADELARRAAEAVPRPDGVFTAGTDFSASVALVAERLGLFGIPHEVALNASDKARMRACFRRAGVPSPTFAEVRSGDLEPASKVDDLLGGLTAGMTFPVVVKPVDNMGARGVRRIEQPADLPDAVHDAVAFSRSGRAVVEEFIDGPEFSVDAIVWNGEVTICGVADRHIYFPPYFVEMGHTIPTGADREVRRRLADVFKAGVAALGIENGAAKGDVFFSGSGPVIGEIAARLSGGYMSGWTYPFASGVEVTAAAMNIAMGNPPGDLTPATAWTSAERAFLSIPGVVREIAGETAARSVHGVREIFLRVSPGGTVRFPRNNVEKSGNVIATLPSRADAVRAAERAGSLIEIVLEPNTPVTDRYLFGPETECPNPFFRLSHADNASAFSAFSERAASRVSACLDGGVPAVSLLRSARRCDALPAWDREAAANWTGMALRDCIRGALLRRPNLFAGPSARPDGATSSGNDEQDDSNELFTFLFWSAALRGGQQGIRYLFDSVDSRR